VTRQEAISILPRFMNAVTAMANATDTTQRLRLAWAIEQVSVFSENEIPNSISHQYQEFIAIISKPDLPQYADIHPIYPKTVPAAYLSPQKAKQATKLLIDMFEQIVFMAINCEE